MDSYNYQAQQYAQVNNTYSTYDYNNGYYVSPPTMQNTSPTYANYNNQYQYSSSSASPSSSVASVSSEYTTPPSIYQTTQNNYNQMPIFDFNSPAPDYNNTYTASYYTPYKRMSPLETSYIETQYSQVCTNTTFPSVSPPSTDNSQIESAASPKNKRNKKSSKKQSKVLKLDPANTNIGFGVPTKTATQTSDISGILKCTMCNQTFNSAAKLFMHQHKYHKNGSSLQCPICYKKFNSQANALVHVRAHTQEKTYKCQQCSLAFCDSSTLKKHIRIHTGEKPYACHLCPKKFTQSGNLKRHLTVHEKYDVIQAKNFNIQAPIEAPVETLETSPLNGSYVTSTVDYTNIQHYQQQDTNLYNVNNNYGFYNY